MPYRYTPCKKGGGIVWEGKCNMPGGIYPGEIAGSLAQTEMSHFYIETMPFCGTMCTLSRSGVATAGWRVYGD